MPADKLLKKQDPPHLPHQPLLRWLVLVLAMVFPSITAWIYFVALAEPSTPVSGSNEANPIVLFAYGLSKAVQFGFPVLWMWFFGRESFRMLRPSPTGLGIGVVFGLAVAAGILAVYFVLLRGSAVLEKTPLLVRDKVVQFGAASPLRYAGLAVFLSAVHSFMEEYYWRWFVFGELKKVSTFALSLVLSSLAFMGHHVVLLAVYFPGHFLTAAIPFSLCTALGGGVWAWIYHRTGSLFSSWLSHLLVDAAIMLVGYDMVFVLNR